VTSLNFSRSEKVEQKIIKQNSGSVGDYSLKKLTESGLKELVGWSKNILCSKNRKDERNPSLVLFSMGTRPHNF
jgi:hypothetical protein